MVQFRKTRPYKSRNEEIKRERREFEEGIQGTRHITQQAADVLLL